MLIEQTVMAAVIALIVQAVKGLLPERPEGEPMPPQGKYYPRDFLPIGVVLFGALVGVGVGLYQALDPLVWAFQGALAGGEALGLYTVARSGVTLAGGSTNALSRATLFKRK